MVPREPNTANWNINKTLCGRYSGGFELPLSDVVRVNFKTDGSVNLTGFDMSLTSVCGGTLYGSSGSLSTEDVVGSQRCEWEIVVREGRTIQITFDNINIVDNNNCQYSYILLRNGASNRSPLLGGGRYCGTSIPEIPESASNRVYIIFNAPSYFHVVSNR